jgi:protein TonB
VPLQISFTLSEPVQEKPKIKPRPKPRPALAEEPVPQEKPVQEAQSKVTPPEYNVAYLNNPRPVYPHLSRRLREQGDVILRVYVTSDGAPGEIQLHTSSGYPRLDNATREAVKRWKFMPARHGEQPVGAWVLVTINWVRN